MYNITLISAFRAHWKQHSLALLDTTIAGKTDEDRAGILRAFNEVCDLMGVAQSELTRRQLWNHQTVLTATFNTQLEQWIKTHPEHSLNTPSAWIDAAEAFRPTSVGLRGRHRQRVANGPKQLKLAQRSLDLRPIIQEYRRTLQDATAVFIDQASLFQAVPMRSIMKLIYDRRVKPFRTAI